jgi:hypothetical protein
VAHNRDIVRVDQARGRRAIAVLDPEVARLMTQHERIQRQMRSVDAIAEGGRRERTCLPGGKGDYFEWPEQLEEVLVEPGTQRLWRKRWRGVRKLNYI